LDYRNNSRSESDSRNKNNVNNVSKRCKK
jgi:hypothetical protein